MSAAEGMQAHLDALWTRSRPQIEARVEAIETAAIALLEGALTADTRMEAEREAHKLAGVAGTFGYPRATDLAREAEALLDRSHVISPADQVRLAAIANELRRTLLEVDRPAARVPEAPPSRNASARVAMIDDDPAMLGLVAGLLGEHDIEVIGTSDPDAFLDTIDGGRIDLLLLDVDMPRVTGIDLSRRIRANEKWDDLPIVFLTARSGAAVELFDAGADNYLMKPVNAAELLSVVRGRVRRNRAASAKAPSASAPAAPSVTREADVDVLIVDDDAMLVELLGHALQSRGYSSRVISDGTSAMELLTGENPTLRGHVVVLDVGLPEHDGLAVLRALARDGITKTSRVIMLTARSLESEVLQALDLGAFDHVAKPFSVPVLMHRIRRALEDKPRVA